METARRLLPKGLDALGAAKTGKHLAIQFCPYYVKESFDSDDSSYNNYPLVLKLVEYCNFKNATISSLVRDRMLVDRASAAAIVRLEEERDALLARQLGRSAGKGKSKGKGKGKGKKSASSPIPTTTTVHHHHHPPCPPPSSSPDVIDLSGDAAAADNDVDDLSAAQVVDLSAAAGSQPTPSAQQQPTPPAPAVTFATIRRILKKLTGVSEAAKTTQVRKDIAELKRMETAVLLRRQQQQQQQQQQRR